MKKPEKKEKKKLDGFHSNTLCKELVRRPLHNHTLPTPAYKLLIERIPALSPTTEPILQRLCWVQANMLIHNRIEMEMSVRFLRNNGYWGHPIEMGLRIEDEFDGILRFEEYCEPHRWSMTQKLGGGRARQFIYYGDDIIDHIREKLPEWWIEPDMEWTYCLTGLVQGRKKAEKVARKAEKDFALSVKETNKLTKLFLMDEYCALVNQLIDNKARRNIIKKNYLAAQRAIIASVAKDRNKQFTILSNLFNNKLLTYYLTNSISSRIHTGEQTLIKASREVLFKGCYDIDLNKSQMSLLAQLSCSQELLAWLTKDIWNSLMEFSGLPKWQCKIVVYAALYCGGRKALLKQGLSEAQITLLEGHQLIKDIRVASGTLIDQIKHSGGGEVAGYWLCVSGLMRPAQILARQLQYLESMIMFSVMKQISIMPRVNLMGSYHDGAIISLAPNREPEYQIKLIEKAVADKCHELGLSPMSLSNKPL